MTNAAHEIEAWSARRTRLANAAHEAHRAWFASYEAHEELLRQIGYSMCNGFARAIESAVAEARQAKLVVDANLAIANAASEAYRAAAAESEPGGSYVNCGDCGAEYFEPESDAAHICPDCYRGR
jgi:hypothetical protein